jgi:hypothetical protein
MVKVNFGADFIQIVDGKRELVYWQEDEWKEDSSVVFSICNAIVLALTRPKKLNKLLDVVKPIR